MYEILVEQKQINIISLQNYSLSHDIWSGSNPIQPVGLVRIRSYSAQNRFDPAPTLIRSMLISAPYVGLSNPVHYARCS